MRSERAVRRLHDMVDDAVRIETFVRDMTLDTFLADERTIIAVERLLQRITEAAIQLSAEDASAAAELPIAQMRALGNRLRHEYRDVDRSVIYDLACNKVPEVLAASRRALED